MTALLAAGVLSATHLPVGKLPPLDARSAIWKSVAGGIGISYAFLVLLPKLASRRWRWEHERCCSAVHTCGA